jgi:hypothetical protein
MSEKNIATAKAYYLAVNNKNVSDVEKTLHPEVQLLSPLASIEGKESVLNAVKRFMTVFNKLTIRTACGSEDQVLLVYDLDCPEPIGHVRTAVLMNFKDDLIARIELFFDARPFEKN